MFMLSGIAQSETAVEATGVEVEGDGEGEFEWLIGSRGGSGGGICPPKRREERDGVEWDETIKED
jgi:hypothetical protein